MGKKWIFTPHPINGLPDVPAGPNGWHPSMMIQVNSSAIVCIYLGCVRISNRGQGWQVNKMKLRNAKFGITGACIAGLAALLAVGSASALGLPPATQYSAEVRYLGGGVGEDESRAMKAEFAHYPLALTFASRIGERDAYTAGVHVTIVGTDGATKLDVVADGPFLLVDLPAGKYRVTADYANRSKTQAAEITAGTRRQYVFVWDHVDRE